MASGQGLIRSLAARKPPSFVSLIGEFGLRLSQMSDDRANTANVSLLRAMLDIYNKSGKNDILGETVYSDKANNTASIRAPAVSLIGESTPETFFANLNEQAITNGLLPRFIIIEYNGPRAPRNRKAAEAMPDRGMMDRLARLAKHSLGANSLNQVTDVKFEADAEAYMDGFDEFCDGQINSVGDAVTKELRNRAHIKALKLAALIAVGCDHERPVITLGIAEWAVRQIERDIHKLISRFDSGDVGAVAGNEMKQQAEVKRVFREFVEAPYDRYSKYGGLPEMHANGIVTHSYLQQRLLTMPAFKNDPIKGTPALKRAMQNLIAAGEFEQLPGSLIWDTFGKKWTCYRIAVENSKSYVAVTRRSGPIDFFGDGPKRYDPGAFP